MEKRIMKAFFANSGRLVCCRPSEEVRELSDRILGLILDISGKPELGSACTRILRQTDIVQTVADCALLGADDLPVAEEQRIYLHMKARRLEHFEVQRQDCFDRTILTRDTLQTALRGDVDALRLCACLDWLEGNRERAIRCWTILAYTGEQFTMEALEYACGRMENPAGAAMWKQVRQICQDADQQFSMSVPKDQSDRNAAETAQLILAVRARCGEMQGSGLPMAMIQYAIDSSDDLRTKIRNLYQAAQPYTLMLADQRQREDKKYGF